MLTRVHYEPMKLWRDFYRDMDRWLENTEGREVIAADWSPAVDIHEEDDRYLLHADLPGVDPNDIEITFNDGMLTVRGERRKTEEKESGGRKVIERSYGSFERSFRLPDMVDADQIEAKTDQGVLNISIPKKEKVQAKKIAVQS